MTRPIVVLAERMYHPAGEALLAEHCKLKILQSATPDDVRAAVVDAHALVVRYPQKADAPALSRGERLVIVACSGRGSDSVDLDAATRLGIAVVNNPGFGRSPVSEGALALMLALAKRLPLLDRRVRSGTGWRDRSFSDFLELAGKTLGVIGFGDIGRETARKAISAFDMQVLVYDPYIDGQKVVEVGAQRMESLDQLLRASDIVSLHPELSSTSRGMIGEAELRQMKTTAFLVNTSRGKVVQEAALLRALQEGWIQGAGLDVYEEEPLGPGHPLCELDNVILMPHVAGLTGEAVEGMSLSAARQVLQALRGECPAHILNPSIWARARQRALASELTI